MRKWAVFGVWLSGAAWGDFDELGPKDPAPKSRPEAKGSRTGLKAPPVSRAGTPEPGVPLGAGLGHHDRSAPVHTEADAVSGSIKQGTLNLKGHVRITQSDTTLLSNEAVISSEAGTNEPKTAQARGDVRLSRKRSLRMPEIRAVADAMDYDFLRREVVLKGGSPKIWRGDQEVGGSEIRFNLETGELEIRGAKAVLHPARSKTGSK